MVLSTQQVEMIMMRRFLLFTTFMIFMNSIRPSNAADGKPCKDDSDCEEYQFCYNLSQICVNYTQCDRYNRYENDTQSQKPTQCGPCLPGFVAEKFIDGTEALVCKEKIKRGDKQQIKFPSINPQRKDNKEDDTEIWVCGAIICSVVLIVLVYLCLKRRVYKHVTDEKWFPMGTWGLSPTAPPPESGIYHLQRPYYSEEDPPIYSAVVNNNNTTKDKNILVNAVPSHAPDWVQIDPSYDLDQDDPDASTSTNISSSTMSNTTFSIEDEETNPSVWTPEQITVAVPARAFHQFAPEQRDNVVNAVLVRGDCSSPRSSSSSETNEPAPEATSSSRPSDDNFRLPNVQINQMITLNMIKSDN